MILPPTHVETTGAPAAAVQATASGQQLQSVYVPTESAAGGVFKIVEKDTGRVIVELPYPLPTVPAGADGASHAVDLQV
jgi:hypothetical protein